jgi:hypothetical protein
MAAETKTPSYDFVPATSANGGRIFAVVETTKIATPHEGGSDKPENVRPCKSRTIHGRGKKQ